jgi:hypothetical protein
VSSLLTQGQILREFMKGKVVLPVVPNITTAMKAEHLGEYSMKFPIACHECEGEQGHEGCRVCEGNGQYMHEINIPWTACKQIYQAMYATAVKQALHAEEVKA